MLKLERLELSGFKSFVDPVAVEFAGGITSIVGPNGCGKSNLSDGMSWVLGEQSAKSLRGGKMEDIIFNGSESRRPLGMAEATLTLRTDPAFPRAEEGRITIGRRVFRSGESQYRLNGKTVRLKEIKDLLMDTGLGIRAYSVIEQGKIGMILSTKPQERRKLLEEAAGITRYKARKRVAEVKLEEALANLLRLEDVIAEVERALRSLKRQAGAARRYQEKQVEFTDLLRRVLNSRWQNLREQLVALDLALEESTAKDAELAAALSRDEAALAAGRESLEKQSEALAAAHQRRSDLAATIEGRQEFLKSSRHTLQEIAERLVSGKTLAKRRLDEVETHQQRLREQEERQTALLEDRDSAAAAVQQDQQQIQEAEQALRAADSRMATLRKQMLAADTDLSGLRNRLHQGQIELERTNSRRHHLEEELEQQAFQLKSTHEQLDLARERFAEMDVTRKKGERDLEKITQGLETTLQKESENNERRQGLRQQISSMTQRQKVLTELSQAQEERRASLEEALEASGFEEPTYLASRLEAVTGWEQALDFYLGELTEAVVLDDEEASVTLARFLTGRVSGGRGTTLLRPLEGKASEDGRNTVLPEIDDDAIVLALDQALKLPAELARALPPAYLVEDPSDAERLARAHPGASFLSRQGIWAQGGLLHVEGDSAIPGVLARERELADLAEALPKLEAELHQINVTLEELVATRATQAKEKNRLEGQVSQARQDLAVSQARLQDANLRVERMAKEQEEIKTRKEEIEARLAGLVERQKGSESELAQAEGRRESLSQDLERSAAEVDAAKSHRESMRTESAGRRGRLDVLQERLDSVEAEVARLRDEIGEGERQALLWTEEGDRLDRRRQELETARAEAETKLGGALEAREEEDEQVILEQEKLDDLRTDLRALEERLAACRTQRDETRGNLEGLRVRQATLHQDKEHLAASYQEQFEAPLPAEPEVSEDNLEHLEAELATCKATLERLGPVNLLAVEEFQEQEERHEFLTTQVKDVADSVSSLRQTIKEINQTSSERFLSTFNEVNITFGEVFQHLFRGGEAQMRLLDEEDVLESGIEIVARPPGKRLQNIQLMSGGEKALTAIALLFALFKTKPSPFCILDEVDAPLDDSNCIRFVQTLREMAKETQFLVITHNKLTMEAAATLYGVTMEERGVSKLVSVEMEEVQPQEELATA